MACACRKHFGWWTSADDMMTFHPEESEKPRPHFPLSRREREEMLEGYDLPSLMMAYKVTLRLPLEEDVSRVPARAAIDAILDAECGPDGQFVRWPWTGP